MTLLEVICHVGLIIHIIVLIHSSYLLNRKIKDPPAVSFLELYIYIESIKDSIEEMTRDELKQAINEINNKTVIERLKLQDKIEKKKR